MKDIVMVQCETPSWGNFDTMPFSARLETLSLIIELVGRTGVTGVHSPPTPSSPDPEALLSRRRRNDPPNETPLVPASPAPR